MNFLIENTVFDLILLEESDSDHEVEMYEIMEQFSTDVTAVIAFRYGIPFEIGSVPKSREIICNVLPNLDESRFRVLVRVNWHTFDYIVSLIKDDEVFKGLNSWKQFPVEVQLAIVLYRLGCSGEGSSVSKVAHFFGIGDGGTIANITKRIFKAISKLKKNFLYWPDRNGRKELVSKTYAELPYCIGYVDGTEIKLAEKPTVDLEAYFSRKNQYSLKMQAVCDYSLKIRHAAIGYPGSIHDSRIYNKCPLYTNSTDYFSESEWILGDSAYRLTTTVITPYRTNATQGTRSERNAFNYYLSQYRVKIENSFALLKERFSSLKELKIVVGNESNNRFACQWIFVCCVLNNIIQTIGADDDEFSPEETTVNDEQVEEDSDINEEAGVEPTNREADMKRRAILELIKNNN